MKQIFLSLHTYVLDKGVPQDPDAPPRCWPGNPLGQQIYHTTDIAEVSGTAIREHFRPRADNSLGLWQIGYSRLAVQRHKLPVVHAIRYGYLE